MNATTTWIRVADIGTGILDHAPADVLDALAYQLRDIHSGLMTENETRCADNLGRVVGSDPTTHAWLGPQDAAPLLSPTTGPPPDSMLRLDTPDGVVLHAHFNDDGLTNITVVAPAKWISDKTAIEVCFPEGRMRLRARGWNDAANLPDPPAELDATARGDFVA